MAGIGFVATEAPSAVRSSHVRPRMQCSVPVNRLEGAGTAQIVHASMEKRHYAEHLLHVSPVVT